MKTLFFDIDGTLVDSYRGIHTIPEGVKQQLRRIQSLGHKIFLCSGRPRSMLSDEMLNAGFDGYVLFNGGYVEVEGQSIFENRMDKAVLVKLCDLFDELKVEYMLETSNSIYLRKDFVGLYHFFSRMVQPQKTFTLDFDRDEVLNRTIKVECNNTNRDVKLIEDCIKEHFGYEITGDQHGAENSFEIFPTTVSKASGIQAVLDYYQASKMDTYAFGDGLNDMEMFDFCQTTIAMGNGVQALKDKATMVCLPVNEDGLELILKELF